MERGVTHTAEHMFYMSTQGKSVTVPRGKIWGVEAEMVVR